MKKLISINIGPGFNPAYFFKPEIEEAEYTTSMINILDKGFVKLLDVMGDDKSICDAARVSTGGQDAEKTEKENERLIRYLLRNGHTSPFEMVEFKFHCKMPIFVARQWIRHRTANVNEMSGRYRILPEEYYVPEVSRVGGQNLINKQGTGEQLPPESIDKFIDLTKTTSKNCFANYNIFENMGISNELARIVTPVNTYTEWYWKIDLHNLLHFLKLRLHPHAQYEIRVYAEAMAEIVKEHVPVTWKAFEDFTLNARTFSAQEMKILKDFYDLYNVSVAGTLGVSSAGDEYLINDWERSNGKKPSKTEIEEFKNKLKC